ncbi:outer membrane porin, OprD family [compost metagenome]
MNYLGATAQLSPNFEVRAFGSRFENMWDQGYLGVTHKLTFDSGYSLKTAFNYYHTQDQGDMRLGYIKTTLTV